MVIGLQFIMSDIPTGMQILTITPDFLAPPSMLCFVISQILGDTWSAFSRVSFSLAPGDGKERTLGTRLA